MVRRENQKNHRYTRISKPNDDAPIERFNRTLQEECLDKISNNVRLINGSFAKKYLKRITITNEFMQELII